MENNFKNIGTIIGLFSATKTHVGLIRPAVQKLELIKDYGIKYDKFAGKKLDSTVMILDVSSYRLANNHAINLQHGSLGENILFDFSLKNFDVGIILKIGDALIQITQKCTICNHLAVFDKRLPKIIKNDRGMYCRILRSGIIVEDMRVETHESI